MLLYHRKSHNMYKIPIQLDPFQNVRNMELDQYLFHSHELPNLFVANHHVLGMEQ
jgi:hypothetical protein